MEWDKPYDRPLTPKSGDVRVLWWNVQFGETDRALRGGAAQGPLARNLIELAEGAAAPDILILGEYEDDVVDAATKSKLYERYSHSPQAFWPYNPKTPERGIMVFSKCEITNTRLELLDYYPSSQSPDDIATYKAKWAKDFPPERFFPREYIHLTFRRDGKAFSIIPFHGLVHIEKEFRDAGGGWLVTNWIKFKMAFSGHNPMIYQLQRLRGALTKDFGESLRGAFLLIGDFNSPRKILGLTTATYAVIAPGLTDLFKNSTESTWPLPSSREAQDFSLQLQIDHAFCSRELKSTLAEILPLKGSDHAALMVDLRI